jgi:hypothetical protein
MAKALPGNKPSPAPSPHVARSNARPGHIAMRVASHGQFQVSAQSMDHLIETFLPARVEELRSHLQRFSDDMGQGIDYSDLTTVTECLMVLGELNGMATN